MREMRQAADTGAPAPVTEPSATAAVAPCAVSMTGPATGPWAGPVVGESETTSQLCVAIGPTLPASSVARTANVWRPSESPARSIGDGHVFQAASSVRQVNVAPASEAEYANRAR